MRDSQTALCPEHVSIFAEGFTEFSECLAQGSSSLSIFHPGSLIPELLVGFGAVEHQPGFGDLEEGGKGPPHFSP